ncbi:hypothetical protein RS130_00150 [Paraglaciecola aquimarina]|uniref:Lipoprotein n=1 Tax=Paraglaciecola aquimarina TaxID=1235557 RepID=A0ABU3SR95_9ALTE|nr:hypothetical protein [Paraglaciecola aquimarina]MDU0352524.1 hypothetical protein [Paraglaciecola aquimarina]
MKYFITMLTLITLTGCSASYPNQNLLGQPFIAVSGQSLAQQQVNIPGDFNGEKTLLLIGYKQQTQFDIDRWLIALHMSELSITTYELPVLTGLSTKIMRPVINNGMRDGIPKELWHAVITVYSQGEKVQKFTGNVKPNNARVVLLNEKGEVIYFYDRGFSVAALAALKQLI